MTDGPTVLRLGDCHDIHLAGGKAINLARLMAAGFPVPDGFVVTTAAYRAAGRQATPTCPVMAEASRGEGMPAEVATEIIHAYQGLGGGVVAVRSSATAEDLASASMAGQYDTFLGVCGETELLEAVEKCWASIFSRRTQAYLAEHHIDPSGVSMAVVVERLVAADVAGVLFTANPRTGSRDEMLIEANWGLGEAVVSGAVQPDTLVLDRATGAVKTATISAKQTWVPPGGRGPEPMPVDKRNAACLTSQDVHELWHLGLRVMEHFGSAQDIEWAIHGGRFFLLQSRAITTLEGAEACQQCLQRTRAQLLQWAREGRGDWVRHNLAETLPHPTPLTWSVVRQFMSGDGGFGAMYRLVGFEPSSVVCKEGFLELIAGKVYMDLSRGGGIFCDGFSYRYDLELLRTNPDAAQGPPTMPVGSPLRQYRTGRKVAQTNRKLHELANDCDRKLDQETFPALVEYVRQEKARDLMRLSLDEWLVLWRDRSRRVLDEFGPQSLLPSLIAAMALDELRALLEEHFWDEDPLALANLFTAGTQPDQTLQASQALYELAGGRHTLPQWLAAHGHRGPEEFDLAAPRWRERPAAVEAMASHLKQGTSPLAMHQKRAEEANRRLDDLAARLPHAPRRQLGEHVRLARRYLRFREDGKHYLMLGYDLLRDLALEAGRRLGVGEEVFLLTFEELGDALATGFAPLHLIEQRRTIRAAESQLRLGHVITAADVETLSPTGDCPNFRSAKMGLSPSDIPFSARYHVAFPLSAGVCTGPARIVLTPEEAGDLGKDYVLVCPSTDPSWTPLFVNAAGLVLECGGTLSHGAVVAREMGIPAVVYAGATNLLEDGEIIAVDGHRGAIVRGGTAGNDAGEQPAAEDPSDTRIPRTLVPPVSGRRERRSARLRNLFLAIWTAYLATAFLLPGVWLYDLSMGVMDWFFWPIVAAWGKPAAVAVVAAAWAATTMIGQWLLTDNRRLRTAKRRAGLLRARAAELPEDSPRRRAMLDLAAPVQMRVVMAAMVPLAVILGPMVLSFLWWFPARVDPASWNPRPGATAYVVATVDGEFTGPIVLKCDPALSLDEASPAAGSLPPIRATLEERLAKWQRQSDLAGLPWEVQEAGRWIGKSLIADLSDYLKQNLPPQTLSWTLATPPDRAGRFWVTLSAEGLEPVETRLVLGDAYPPEPKEELGTGKAVQTVRPIDPSSPIKLVKVTYSEQKRQGADAFWTPFAALGWSGWDAGWLLLYLVVYLPVMLVCRWALRVA